MCTCWNSSDSGQVDECKVEHMRREDLEVDALAGDALVGPGDSISLRGNLVPECAKIVELLAR